MRSQKGITLITLAISVVILLIISSITIVNSIELYEQMNYEAFQAELEEVQAAVDKICEKYKTKGYTSYNNTSNGFFKSEYGSIPYSLDEVTKTDEINNIINTYLAGNASIHDGYVYYFSIDTIEKYLNLKGISYNIIVDFSTRYVYAVEGCKEPTENVMHYTILDYDPNTVITYNPDKTTSTSSGITLTTTAINSGLSSFIKVSLKLEHNDTGKIDYNIKKAYYSTDGGTSWAEVDMLGDCKYSDDTVEFVIQNAGQYLFKIQDTSGKEISIIEGTGTVAEVTFN